MSTTSSHEGPLKIRIPTFPKGATSAADNIGFHHWTIGFETSLRISGLHHALYLRTDGTDEDETKQDEPKTPKTPRKSKPSKEDKDITDGDCAKAFAYLIQAIYDPQAEASVAFKPHRSVLR